MMCFYNRLLIIFFQKLWQNTVQTLKISFTKLLEESQAP